jgi:hypothetical protein
MGRRILAMLDFASDIADDGSSPRAAERVPDNDQALLDEERQCMCCRRKWRGRRREQRTGEPSREHDDALSAERYRLRHGGVVGDAAIHQHLDPRPHDPWPRHASEPGASLAVTLQAYRAIGGLPCIAFGEDGALVAALTASGLPTDEFHFIGFIFY